MRCSGGLQEHGASDQLRALLQRKIDWCSDAIYILALTVLPQASFLTADDSLLAADETL